MRRTSVLAQHAHGLSPEGWVSEKCLSRCLPWELVCDSHRAWKNPKPCWTYVYRDNLINWCHLCCGFATLNLRTWLLTRGSWLSMLLAGLKRQQLEKIKITPHSLLEGTCLVNGHTLIFKVWFRLNYLFIRRQLNWFQMEVQRRLLLQFNCF